MAIVFAIIFAALTILVRLSPHAPNIVPVGALALWCGAYLPKKWGLIAPIAVMLVSDAVIGFYNPGLMASVYASFVLIAVIGWSMRGKVSAGMVVLYSLAGSVSFYLITNFAVWSLSSWYAHNLSGLISAYVMGLPFFRNTLAGDLLYNSLFFGAYALVKVLATRIARRPTSVPDRIVPGTAEARI